MEKRILVPLDNHDASKTVIQIADDWGQRTGAKVSFLHVVNPYHNMGEGDKKPLFEEMFEETVSAYKPKSDYEVLIRLGKPYVKILELVDEINPDLIIMANHPHGMLGRLFLGSNTERILHRCNVPVYIHKASNVEFANKILVPLDYSEESKMLAAKADEWAKRTQGELVFVHINEVEEYPGSVFAMESGFYHVGDEQKLHGEEQHAQDVQDAKVKKKLDDYLESLNLESSYESYIRFGSSYVKILELQKKTNAGIIFMAAHTHSTAERMISASNTDHVLHHGKCPMYVFRH